LAAVDAACGVIPMLRERVVNLDHPSVTMLMLNLSHMYEGEWEKNWSKLARLPVNEFQQEAGALLGQIAGLKSALRGEPSG
jgi:hypothetical protein